MDCLADRRYPREAATKAHGLQTREYTGGGQHITDSLQSLNARTVELQPGLVVGLYSGNGRSEASATLMNTSGHVHFSCLLRDFSQAKVRGKVFAPKIGEGHMVFAPGERFSVRYGPNYCHVDLMVEPKVLAGLLGDDFDPIGESLGKGFVMCKSHPGNKTIEAATRLVQRMEQPGQPLILLQAAALEFLGWHLNGLSPDAPNCRVPLRERRCLLAARERLLHNLSAPPTIAELSHAVGLNQLKLKRGFKALFGTSIYEFFQRHRMDHARQLLRNHSVTETAVMLGYSNMSHFGTAFRKQFGVLPSEARKNGLT